jgi:flagellar motility protein MotE (MotC chaperone)
VAGGILSYMEAQKAAAITKRLISSRGKQGASPAQAETE